jgi:kynurenine 3-monooxygenase
MGTVHTSRWNVDGKMLLLGDAAHAIVPFHGQGVNCAFEDCRVLCEEFDRGGGWADAFAAFERRRRDDVAAIAQMALENYQEMRAGVSDAHYLASRALALRLERLHPGRIVPRYSMVMFHPELGYAQAQRRGAAQQALVDEILRAGPPERLSDAELAAHPGVTRLLAELPRL